MTDREEIIKRLWAMGMLEQIFHKARNSISWPVLQDSLENVLVSECALELLNSSVVVVFIDQGFQQKMLLQNWAFESNGDNRIPK